MPPIPRKPKRPPLSPFEIAWRQAGQFLGKPPKPWAPKRVDQEVDTRVGAELRPIVDPLQRERERGQHLYQVAAERSRQLHGSFAKVAAEDFSSNPYMAAQVMHLGTESLAAMTNDFTDRDWEIASKIATAVSQTPALRQQIREQIESGQAKTAGDYQNERRQIAAMFLADIYNYGRLQQGQARVQQGNARIDQTARSQALQEARERTNATATVWTVVPTKNGYTIRDSGKPKAGWHVDPKTGRLAQDRAPEKPKDKTGQALERGRLAKQWSDMTGVRSDWKGNPIPGPDGKPQPLKPGSATKAKNDPLKDPKIVARRNAQTDIRDLVESNSTKVGTRTKKPQFYEVWNLGLQTVMPEMLASGYSKSQVKVFVRRYLAALGVRPKK